jgi:hypothetical protein
MPTTTTTTGRRSIEPIDVPDPPLRPIPAPKPNKSAPTAPELPIGDERAEPPTTIRRTADEVAVKRAQAPGEDITFSRGPARRPVAVIADPLLQWASGLPTAERTIYAGWLVEAGRDDELDAAMGQAEIAPVAIRHGSGKVVTHWAIPTASIFLIADGVQTIAEMKGTADRFGIAFGWRRLPDGRMQSQLRCRVLLRELLAVGYTAPLLLTVKGTATGDLLNALVRQYDVLDANAALREQAGKEPWHLPYYAFSIPLGPGQEVTRGSGSATKEITPIVTTIPEAISKEYLKAHWIGRGWVETIEPLIDTTIAWSISESAAIAEGSDERPGWEGNGDA